MSRSRDFEEADEALIDMASCIDEDSDEGTLMQFLCFQRAFGAMQENFQTRNLCKYDTHLSLSRIDASVDYIVVWLQHGQSLDDDIRQDAEEKLRFVFINTQFFTSMDTCLCYLEQLDPNTVHLILISSCSYNGRVSNLTIFFV